jgi:hypothetical protein
MFEKLFQFLNKQSVCLWGSNDVIFRDDVELVICSFGALQYVVADLLLQYTVYA